MERAVDTQRAAAMDEGERADAEAATTEKRRAGLTDAAVEEVAQRFGQQQLGAVVGEAVPTATNVVALTPGPRAHVALGVSRGLGGGTGGGVGIGHGSTSGET